MPNTSPNLPEFENDTSGQVQGVCIAYLSDVPDSVVVRDKFLQQGMRGTCPFCKGPTILVPPHAVEQVKNRIRNGDNNL